LLASAGAAESSAVLPVASADAVASPEDAAASDVELFAAASSPELLSLVEASFCEDDGAVPVDPEPLLEQPADPRFAVRQRVIAPIVRSMFLLRG